MVTYMSILLTKLSVVMAHVTMEKYREKIKLVNHGIE